ncbi:hypothetical protein IW261DRAFT_1420959 [Armillaria novae-zelandiae]|uniref:Uncharacterized protein n=1 Tax=Armillaria novae-zelandiae TaxID=153914 RepID=A0AA39UCX2_9AGAR|nr:hypothetical protein IW261DRAFT_1420959 [Armillaria novae-zelandiae]
MVTDNDNDDNDTSQHPITEIFRNAQQNPEPQPQANEPVTGDPDISCRSTCITSRNTDRPQVFHLEHAVEESKQSALLIKAIWDERKHVLAEIEAQQELQEILTNSLGSESSHYLDKLYAAISSKAYCAVQLEDEPEPVHGKKLKYQLMQITGLKDIMTSYNL